MCAAPFSILLGLHMGDLHGQDSRTGPLLDLDGANACLVLRSGIVTNAAEYSPPGRDIFVRLKREAGLVRREVREEGPGLSPEDQKKLFGTFARLSAKPTGGEHSTGLGLSIVKKMVEAMNGRVWCKSELGRGANFIVEFAVAGGTKP